MKCCGVDGPIYWANSVPDSCCETKDGLFQSKCTTITAYDQGCVDALIDELKSVTVALGITALLLGILMVRMDSIPSERYFSCKLCPCELVSLHY